MNKHVNLYHRGVIKLVQSASGSWEKIAPERKQQLNNDETVLKHSILNPLCGDQVNWYVKIEQKKFTLLSHETIGCILCQAASCLTHQLLQDQPIALLKQQFKNNNFSSPNPYFSPQWSAFEPVLLTPLRLQCVALPINGLQQLTIPYYDDQTK